MSNMRGNITLTPTLPARATSSARCSPARRGCGRSIPAPGRSCCSRRSAAITCWTSRRARAGSSSPGVYLASEGGVELGLYREPAVPELWAGDGFLLEDHGQRRGRVAIDAPGPVETVEISEGELRVQGRLVLGRTDRARVLLAALGAVPAQLHLRAAAAAGLRRHRARRWSAGRRTGTSTCTS